MTIIDNQELERLQQQMYDEMIEAPTILDEQINDLAEHLGKQLVFKEKQKVRFIYGLTEKQFKKTFNEASKLKGVHGENLLKLLESRLDNIVYRIGFASTRRGARQLVNHGHILVDGKKVDIPSYRLRPGQVVSMKEADKELKVVKESLEKVFNRVEFINYDNSKMTGTLMRLPERNELNPEINEALIVEYYNKI